MRCQVGAESVFIYSGERAVAGAQPTVVFIHGAACDHSVWSLQSRYFAYHGHNALAVDLPGHGRSAGAPPDSVEAAAHWLVRLLDTLGVERATLVGHSLGALIALEAAARHARRATRVALLGPAVPMPVADVLLDAARADDPVAYELINSWSFSPGHQLGGNALPGVWMTGSSLRLMQRARPGALYKDLLACHRYEGGLSAAAQLRCPALLILGGRDLMAPAKNAQPLIAALADRRVVTLPDCGHSVMTEAPDAVLDALRDFLRGEA